MDRMLLYDILYALAAEDGREAALFGSCGPAAREAFSRSLAGDAFPELWFEVPLAGDSWLDFHALTWKPPAVRTCAAPTPASQATCRPSGTPAMRACSQGG